MTKFLVRRLLYGLITLLGVTVITFALARLTGSPAALYLPQNATSAMIEEFNHEHGYDRPLPEQFISFLGQVVHLDFGQSLSLREPAMDAILRAAPITLLLMGVTLVVTLVVAMALGILAAMYQARFIDRVITVISLILASIPDFWVALMAILVFSVQAGLLPTSGNATAASWVMPVAVLALSPIGVLTQVIRGAMAEAMGSTYVEACRARGLSKGRRVFVHALRNAAIPIITLTGDRARGLINGALIVGTVFAFPGIGYMLVNAVNSRDFAVLQAGVFIAGVGIIILNIVVDVIYALADPRVRVS